MNPHHEIYRTWVGLINDEDPEDIEIQGYLKLSIQVIGPGDKHHVHDEAADKKAEKEAEKEAGGSISGSVMMPPALKRFFLPAVSIDRCCARLKRCCDVRTWPGKYVG